MDHTACLRSETREAWCRTDGTRASASSAWLRFCTDWSGEAEEIGRVVFDARVRVDSVALSTTWRLRRMPGI